MVMEHYKQTIFATWNPTPTSLVHSVVVCNSRNFNSNAANMEGPNGFNL